MRKWLLVLGALAFGLVIACGGGDDSKDAATSTPSGAADTVAATQSSSGGDAGSGAGSDFCGPEEENQIFGQFGSSGAAATAIDYDAVRNALDKWVDSAPGDYKDDAKVMRDGIRGLLELLQENDGDFMAMAMGAANDPRMLALDSDTFQAANDRISSYCGWDINLGLDGSSTGGGNGGSSGSSGSGSGSSGGGFTGAIGLPDGFPEELAPPDSELTFSGTIAGATTVEWSSTLTIQEVLDYYGQQLGSGPSYADAESAIWQVPTDNKLTTVSVQGTDGDLAIQITILTQ